jgi:hypothetical protein
MPYFIQANSEGRNLCVVQSDRSPQHPRQIGPYSDLPDMVEKRLDLNTMELVDDKPYWDAIKKKQAIGETIRTLAEQKINEEISQKPVAWDGMTVDEKAQYYMNFTAAKLAATMD